MHDTAVSAVAPKPRAHVGALPASVHGSLSDAELRALGVSRGSILDLSASINPLGPSPRAIEALAGLSVDGSMSRYPDDGGPALREGLAGRDRVEPAQVIVANGAVELLWLLALAYLEPGDLVLVVGPTFGEYARAARIAGATVIEWRAEAGSGFVPDSGAIAAAVEHHHPRLVFLCNPNNPTGVCLDHAAIGDVLQRVGSALLVVDAAYAPFATCAPNLHDLLPDGRLVLLHSLTKSCALAGLRLGYAVADRPVIAALDRVRPPWTVNAAAIACGLAALADTEHQERSLAEVAESRACLELLLTACGLHVYASSVNFVLVDVGDGARFRARLLRRGICVRDCASFGLPACVRIAVPAMAQIEIVGEAIQSMVIRGRSPLRFSSL